MAAHVRHDVHRRLDAGSDERVAVLRAGHDDAIGGVEQRLPVRGRPVGLPHGHPDVAQCPAGTATASARAPCARRPCRRRSAATSRRAAPGGRRATRRRSPRATATAGARARPGRRRRRSAAPAPSAPARRRSPARGRTRCRRGRSRKARRTSGRGRPGARPARQRRRRPRIPSQPSAPDSAGERQPPSAGTCGTSVSPTQQRHGGAVGLGAAALGDDAVVERLSTPRNPGWPWYTSACMPASTFAKPWAGGEKA